MIFYDKKTTYDNYNKYALEKKSYKTLLDAYKNLNECWKLIINDLTTDEFVLDIKTINQKTKELLKRLNAMSDLDVCSDDFYNALNYQLLYKTLSQLHSKGVSKETMIDQAYAIENKYGLVFRCIDMDIEEILNKIEMLKKYSDQIKVA